MNSFGLAKVTEIVDADRFIIRMTIAGVIEDALAYPLTNDDMPAVDEEILVFAVDSIESFSYFYMKLRLLEYTKFEYEGNLVILNNDGISVTTADGNTISVSVDGDISITTSSNLSIHSDGDLAIEAGGSISITSGSDISISSSANLAMEASSDISIEAGANLALSGSSECNLDATSISISGTSTLELTAGTLTFPNRIPTVSSGPFNGSLTATCLFSAAPHSGNSL